MHECFGQVVLRQVDQRIALARSLARVFDDNRRRVSVAHSMRGLLAQRIDGLCCGWEVGCDHNVLPRSGPHRTGQADFLLSTGTFCLNVWKLFLSSMQNVQQHQPCMAVADAFSSLICIRQIIWKDSKSWNGSQ